jgi:lipid-binding SYLF domain-containing protein
MSNSNHSFTHTPAGPAAFRARRGNTRVAAVLAALLLLSLPAAAIADEEEERIDEAILALEEIMDAPDAAIPDAILERAVAIAVFPSTVKAGFFLGGQRGRGFIATRHETGEWSAPAFMTLTGGSIGLQVGAQSVDIILLIQNRRGLSRLLDNEFKLGGDASAVVGPVGRTVEASTDLQMTAEILSYSRSRGVFAGLSLGGATLRADRDANERFYGERLDSRDIVLDGETGTDLPDAVTRLRQTLDTLLADEDNESK